MELALEKFGAQLTDRGASLPTHFQKGNPLSNIILSILEQHGVVDERDLVFIGGSRADGLGNGWSDFDVFVITDRWSDPLVGSHLVPMPHDQLPLDLEVWRVSEVEELLARLRIANDGLPNDHRTFMSLTDDERDFLHSLTNAVPVQNEDGIIALQSKLVTNGLSRLSIARALVGITNTQTDLLGWLAVGDWQSACSAGQKLVEFSALAMLGTVGCTHLGGKWLIPLLRIWFPDARLPPRLLRGVQSLADRVYGLTIRPMREEDAHRYVCDCVDFCNRAVLFTQMNEAAGQHELMREVLWEPLGTSSRESGNEAPSLGPALQLRLNDGQWYVIRVGHEMYEVNEVAAAIIMLVDGAKGGADLIAAMRRAGVPAIEGLERSICDVLLFLANADLLSP